MRIRDGLLILSLLVSLAWQAALDVEENNSDIVLTAQENDDEIPMERAAVAGLKYDYSKSAGVGPRAWKDAFPDYCAKTEQSPINLIAAEKEDYPAIEFDGYDKKPDEMWIKNNGNTAKVYIKMDPMPKISGGGLDGEYQFSEMHWHWGDNVNEKKGSEHKRIGRAYPMELHMVHWNTEYGNIETAKNKSDGLAVLGIFIKTKKRTAKKSPYNKISKALKHIKKCGSRRNLPPRKMERFIPKDTSGFFRYKGSLTTPTCDEVVIWTVFKKKKNIRKKWLKKFYKLKTNLGVKMINNYRPVQPLNGRTITMRMTRKK